MFMYIDFRYQLFLSCGFETQNNGSIFANPRKIYMYCQIEHFIDPLQASIYYLDC